MRYEVIHAQTDVRWWLSLMTSYSETWLEKSVGQGQNILPSKAWFVCVQGCCDKSCLHSIRTPAHRPAIFPVHSHARFRRDCTCCPCQGCVVQSFCVGFLNQVPDTAAYGANVTKRKRARADHRSRLPAPTLEGLIRRQAYVKRRIRDLQSPWSKPQSRQVWQSVFGAEHFRQPSLHP